MNDKVKSLFFSQYWGQKRLSVSDKAIVQQIIDSWFIERYIDTAHLLLRDISQLTDEENEVVAKLCGFEQQESFYIAGEGIDILDSIYGDAGEIGYPAKDYITINSYMLLIGILTSFTYLSETNQPITLTPAEIINLGWAKIKSNEQ